MGILRFSATGTVTPILTRERQVRLGVSVISSEDLNRDALVAGRHAPDDRLVTVITRPWPLHFTRQGPTRNLDENACRADHFGPTGNVGIM